MAAVGLSTTLLRATRSCCAPSEVPNSIPRAVFALFSQAIRPDISFPNHALKTRKNTILKKSADRRMARGTRAFGYLHPNAEFAFPMPEFSQVAGMWFPVFVQGSF